MTLTLKSSSSDETLIVDEDELELMNRSELVQLCRFIGVRAHRGVKTTRMIDILKGNDVDHEVNNPIDPLRDLVSNFLKEKMGNVKSQLKIGCDGDCYQHTDMQVLLCWITNKGTIKRYS